MGARHTAWYCDPLGRAVEPLALAGGLEYVRTFSGVGYMRVPLPARGQPARVRPDWRVHFWRQPANGPRRLELVGFLLRFGWGTDGQGRTQYSLQGRDAAEQLKRRIVAYYANSTEADVSGVAGDLMKEAVRDNLGADAGGDYSGSVDGRDVRSWLGRTLFRVADDLGDGPSIEKGLAWQNLMSALQGMQAAARTAGDEVFFAVEPVTPGLLEFRTYTGQPGRDRTVSAGGRPLIFSLERGNLADPTLAYDYQEARNVVYAGGLGNETDRQMQTAVDANLRDSSPWARREAFAQAVGFRASGSVQDVADDELARVRPARTLTAEILSTAATPYGAPGGWDLGDRVTLDYGGQQVDVLIRGVHVQVNGTGREIVRGQLEPV